MSQEGDPSPSPEFPRGAIWAALLIGIAAIIGAVALLIFVLSSTGLIGGPKTLGDTSAVPTPATVPTSDAQSAMPATAAGGAGGLTPAAVPTAGAASRVPVGSPSPGTRLVVEDWSGYADDEALRAAFDVNTGWADNSLSLSLMPAVASPHGPAGIAAGYSIEAVAPNDYVGMERDLVPAQDWRGYDRLAAWVATTDRSPRQLVLQFHEGSGEVWRHRAKLADVPADGPLLIPLTPDQWEWAEWSERQNQVPDLNEITRLGIFIGHDGPGACEVRLGTIEVQQGP
jgi:hypothetical protein